MKVLLFATALCCIVRSLPAFAFGPGSVGSVMAARNPSRRAGRSSATPIGGFRHQHRQNAAARQEEGLGLLSGDGSSDGSSGSGSGGHSRPVIAREGVRRADLRRGGWSVRSTGLRGWGVLGGLTALFSASASASSSSPGDGGEDLDSPAGEANEPQPGDAVAVGAASGASSSAGVAAAASGGVVSGSTSSSGSADGDGSDRSGVVDAGAGEGGGAIAVGPGISWATLSAVVASQLAFVGLFGWISSPAIREQVFSSFSASSEAAALGVAGMLPLLVYGLALDLRRDDWDWVRKIDQATSEVALQLFGSERQVGKVIGIAIPLAMLIGVCEECAFRGLLPLFIAAKTGLPTAAVVALSGIIFGSLHAATLAYFLTATVSGFFFHGLLLFSGNIFVPIVAHAVYDAIALVRYHVKVTAGKQK